MLTVGDLGALNLGSVEVPPPAVGATADAKTLKERLLATCQGFREGMNDGVEAFGVDRNQGEAQLAS